MHGSGKRILAPYPRVRTVSKFLSLPMTNNYKTHQHFDNTRYMMDNDQHVYHPKNQYSKEGCLNN